jgi:hypothetical protein
MLQHSVSYAQHPNVRLSITLSEHLPPGWAGASSPWGGFSPSGLLGAAYYGFALQTPAQINVSGCEGQGQLVVRTPGLAIQPSDCVSNTIPIQLHNLSAWPTMPINDSEHVLFWAGYSTNYMNETQWFGPTLMEPTQPLPVPP